MEKKASRKANSIKDNPPELSSDIRDLEKEAGVTGVFGGMKKAGSPCMGTDHWVNGCTGEEVPNPFEMLARSKGKKEKKAPE